MGKKKKGKKAGKTTRRPKTSLSKITKEEGIAPLVGPLGMGPDNERPIDIEQELSTIYLEDEEGSEPDMTKLEQTKHSTFRKVVVGLIIFLTVVTAVSAVGYFYFGPKGDGFTGEQVTLAIDGPEETKSGEKVSYKFKYRNASDTPLGTASLELRLPENFQLLEAEPPATDQHTWKIGSMPPWGRGEIEITGMSWTPLNREHDIQAIITYRPANFNSEFQKVATQTVRAVDTLLELEMETQGAVLPGDQVEVIINYLNGSEAPIENAAVRADFPDEFIPESSVPEPAGDTFNEWRLGTLNEFGSGSIIVTGTFASEAHGNVTLPATFGYTDETDSYVKQAEASTITEVLQGKLVAALVLNGKSDKQSVSLGDMLRYSISYRNTGSASLGNVEIAVVVEAVPDTGLVLWNELDDDLGGNFKNNKITWTEKHIESLERLEENDEGMIDFKVPLTLEPPVGTETSNWVINSWVETLVESIDGDVINHVTKSAPIEATILSDTELKTSARFYDEEGLSLGSGVIPPEVGKETTYRVFWTVKNSLHELSDLKISAQLPSNVEWSGESSIDAGDIRYDAAEREMIWTLNWLPKTVEEVNLSFDVTIIPLENQRGRIPTLVDATVFEATDTAAEATIMLSDSPISTSLQDDDLAQGKGRVR